MEQQQTREGMVVKRTFSAGSKSEHPAMYLQTDAGEAYVLRRSGGNPFSDPVLQQLEGKRIRATGAIADYLFIISSYEVL